MKRGRKGAGASASDPTVTWIQERKYIYAYNPLKKVYEQKPANNPAWVCYDILHICRKIGNEYVVFGQPHERIDYDAFKAWADKCTEQDFQFNYIYDAASRIWDALKYPEAVGRGKVIPSGTKFTCICDYVSTPVQLFTVSNIKQDSFSEAFQSADARANAVEISFLNKDKAYERASLLSRWHGIRLGRHGPKQWHPPVQLPEIAIDSGSSRR